jgi:hypothetical protein
MKKAMWLFITLAGISLWSSGAQAEAPWPPHPADLFAEDVEVLYTYPAFDSTHLTLYLYRDS